MSIRFHYDQIKFRIRRTGEIKRFLEKVVRDEKNIPGDLIFILTNDKRMLDINIKFLKHNYFTDVIAFNYSEERTINGEIYLGFETIRRNAKAYGSTLKTELLRVMIHGLLHLCGYNDISKRDRNKMSQIQEKLVQEYILKNE